MSLSSFSNGDDTDADPNFELPPINSIEVDYEENIVSNTTKKKIKRQVKNHSEINKNVRKRIANQENWRKNVVKKLRNTGKSYVSSSKSNKFIEAKKLLPPCGEKCKLKCFTKFTEENRQSIFDDYWKLGDIDKQRYFLSSSMKIVKPKYRYVRENSHRRENNSFYFEVNKNTIRVCKHFFKATLCINDRPLRTVVEKQDSFTGKIIANDYRGKHKNHVKVPYSVKEDIRHHIQSIPRIESHYCRANTSKEFIEGGKSIADLHRDYKSECKEKNIFAANYVMYARIFNEEFNISFFTPKKDQCELCISYENSDTGEKVKLQEKYDTHLKEKKLSRLEKEIDKKSNCVTAVYDLQAVLPCPLGNASSFYYVSKLNVFNLTVYNLQTSNDVQCYVWHEGQANRGANDIGSCILNYLKDLQQNAMETESNSQLNVIFYSDNCARQQKNKFILAMYLYAVLNFSHINSITHKYLITGHTKNEGDNVHSVIEQHIKKSKKSGPIYVPEQYVTLIRTAKKSGNPY